MSDEKKNYTNEQATELLRHSISYSPSSEDEHLREVKMDDYLRIMGHEGASTQEAMQLAEEYNGLRSPKHEDDKRARFNYSSPRNNPLFYFSTLQFASGLSEEEAWKLCTPNKEVAKVIHLNQRVADEQNPGAAISGT